MAFLYPCDQSFYLCICFESICIILGHNKTFKSNQTLLKFVCLKHLSLTHIMTSSRGWYAKLLFLFLWEQTLCKRCSNNVEDKMFHYKLGWILHTHTHTLSVCLSLSLTHTSTLNSFRKAVQFMDTLSNDFSLSKFYYNSLSLSHFTLKVCMCERVCVLVCVKSFWPNHDAIKWTESVCYLR